MFINLSNHALQNWSLKQKEEAVKYGELIDLPFPNISPYADSVEIDRLVEKYFNKVLEYHNPVVMLQGEFIFTFRLATKLKAAGIKVVAGRSERIVVESVNSEGIPVKKVNSILPDLWSIKTESEGQKKVRGTYVSKIETDLRQPAGILSVV